MVHNQKTILPRFSSLLAKVLPPRWQSLAIGWQKVCQAIGKSLFSLFLVKYHQRGFRVIELFTIFCSKYLKEDAQ